MRLSRSALSLLISTSIFEMASSAAARADLRERLAFSEERWDSQYFLSLSSSCASSTKVPAAAMSSGAYPVALSFSAFSCSPCASLSESCASRGSDVCIAFRAALTEISAFFLALLFSPSPRESWEPYRACSAFSRFTVSYRSARTS